MSDFFTFLAFWVGFCCVVSANRNVHHMEIDRTDELNLFKQIEKSLFGPKQIIPEVGSFEWGNCRDNVPVKIKSMALNPDPLVVGKPVTLSLTLLVGQTLTDPVEGKLLIQLLDKQTKQWQNMCPFLPGNFCNLGNICAKMQEDIKKCPKELTDIKLNCRCPIEANTYTIKNYTFPNVPAIPIEGTFKASWNLTMKGEQMSCGYIQLDYSTD